MGEDTFCVRLWSRGISTLAGSGSLLFCDEGAGEPLADIFGTLGGGGGLGTCRVLGGGGVGAEWAQVVADRAGGVLWWWAACWVWPSPLPCLLCACAHVCVEGREWCFPFLPVVCRKDDDIPMAKLTPLLWWLRHTSSATPASCTEATSTSCAAKKGMQAHTALDCTRHAQAMGTRAMTRGSCVRAGGNGAALAKPYSQGYSWQKQESITQLCSCLPACCAAHVRVRGDDTLSGKPVNASRPSRQLQQ